MIHQNASTVENEIQNEKMINQLKAKVLQLQDENNALKTSKFNSYSVPDLSNPSHYRSVSTDWVHGVLTCKVKEYNFNWVTNVMNFYSCQANEIWRGITLSHDRKNECLLCCRQCLCINHHIERKWLISWNSGLRRDWLTVRQSQNIRGWTGTWCHKRWWKWRAFRTRWLIRPRYWGGWAKKA